VTTSPVAEEAARLIGALEEWLLAGGLSGGVASSLRWADSHVGGAQECRLCPFCQLLAVVRTAQPEAYQHLAAAVTSLAAAARVLADGLDRGQSERQTVQRIDIGP
jgi:hypothetical protein